MVYFEKSNFSEQKKMMILFQFTQSALLACLVTAEQIN